MTEWGAVILLEEHTLGEGLARRILHWSKKCLDYRPRFFTPNGVQNDRIGGVILLEEHTSYEATMPQN
jgi:hypothetical protein